MFGCRGCGAEQRKGYVVRRVFQLGFDFFFLIGFAIESPLGWMPRYQVRGSVCGGTVGSEWRTAGSGLDGKLVQRSPVQRGAAREPRRVVQGNVVPQRPLFEDVRSAAQRDDFHPRTHSQLALENARPHRGKKPVGTARKEGLKTLFRKGCIGRKTILIELNNRNEKILCSQTSRISFQVVA